MGVLEIFGSLLLAVGCLVAVTGSLGVLRMPDFYSRLHPAGKTDTLGQLLMLSGLMLFAGQQILTLVLAAAGAEGNTDSAALSSSILGWANILLKVLLVSALLFVTAPTSTHAIAKAARLDRYTAIPVEGDPAQARVHHIAVEDDITRRLDEPAMTAPAEALERFEQEEPR